MIHNLLDNLSLLKIIGDGESPRTAGAASFYSTKLCDIPGPKFEKEQKRACPRLGVMSITFTLVNQFGVYLGFRI